jgi:hypothetical protein
MCVHTVHSYVFALVASFAAAGLYFQIWRAGALGGFRIDDSFDFLTAERRDGRNMHMGFPARSRAAGSLLAFGIEIRDDYY